MNALALLTLLAAQVSQFRDVPDPPPIEQRVTALEVRLDAVERQLAGKPLAVVPTIKDGKETYEQALARALATGKPMIVWCGDAICPMCVAANKDEFVSYVTDNFHGVKSGLIVALPIQGVMRKIATKTEWPEGHIPTVRQAIAEFRAGTQTARSEPRTTFYPQPQYQMRRMARN